MNKIEYVQLAKEIRDKLRELKLPKSEKKLFAKVELKDDCFKGKYFSNIPDIVVSSAIRGTVAMARLDHKYNLFSSVEEICSQRTIKSTGTHSSSYARDGIFVFAGHDICALKERFHYDMMDIAPTALYLLSLNIPGNMNGEIMVKMINKDFKLRHKPKYLGNSEWQELPPYDEFCDEERIRKKLEELGYL